MRKMTNANATAANCRTFLVSILCVLLHAPSAGAHHSIASEYPTTGELLPLSGTVTKIRWYAPHIEIYISASSGIADSGDQWIVNSHAPGLLARTYGVFKDDVAVGDKVEFLGWKSNHDVSRFAMRAIRINDGPMRSTLRPADQRAIQAGTLGDIVPAPGLDGSSYAADIGAEITDAASVGSTGNEIVSSGSAANTSTYTLWLVFVIALLLISISWKFFSGRSQAT
jgi:hypothetical protein